MLKFDEIDQALQGLPARQQAIKAFPEPLQSFLAQFIDQQEHELIVIQDSSEGTA